MIKLIVYTVKHGWVSREFTMDCLNELIYTSESGTEYKKIDVLELARFNLDYANILIERAEWEHIETIIENDLIEGEIEEIDGKYYMLPEEEIKGNNEMIPVHINEARYKGYFYSYDEDNDHWVRSKKIPEHLERMYLNPSPTSNYK